MAEQQKFPGRSVRFRTFIQEEQRVPWLVHGLLPAVGWTLLIGSKGVGKTTLALQLCQSIQEGKSFLCRPTVQADVLFVQMDSPEVEWREICRRVVPQSIGRTLVSAPAYSLDNKAYIAAFSDLIAKSNPGLIIWDSLYRLSARKINTEAILETVEVLQLLCGEIPYIVLHHPPHGDATRASGHNSLSATCSNEWVLSKNKLTIAKGRLIELREILIERSQKDPGLWYLIEDTPDEDNALDRLLTNGRGFEL